MTARLSILVIEDDKSICSFITTTLSGNGYRVRAAFTGREGLSLAASLCPDVILLDLGLPDVDGCEVLQKIRLWSHVPIIIISARNEEQEKVKALDMGADDYITKASQSSWPGYALPCATTAAAPPRPHIGHWILRSTSRNGWCCFRENRFT